MDTHKTVAQSVRDEVDRHHRQILKLEESAIRIAATHKCPDHSLIRLALLRRSMQSRTVLRL